MHPPPGLVATPRAFASLRRITLADGPEAGLDCVAMSTGGGLDCWLLAGRSLDIGPLWWRGRQLGWMPPQGFLHPAFRRAEEEGGHGFARLFGGALVTCGLSHIRQPAGGEPLHGRFPFTPARLTLCRERDELLEVEAEVVEARLGGPVLRLCRRIEADVGGAELRIRDIVENVGPSPAPFAVLYHFNFGWPLVGPGVAATLDGAALPLPYAPGDPAAEPHVTCLAVRNGTATLTSPTGPSLTLRFDPVGLPWLQLWHDMRPSVCVLSLEPCSVGRDVPLPLLAPGEVVRTSLSLLLADGASNSP
ncbi:DUF4432 family protein [Falsiroseomonas sp. HW251]|uniref:DUF4432 family protein n=1 Tax=Falsiroseomonas sp. HW251 TaxID=3390998 RepID=UPI003D31711B